MKSVPSFFNYKLITNLALDSLIITYFKTCVYEFKMGC
jgi:hypothetical protein